MSTMNKDEVCHRLFVVCYLDCRFLQKRNDRMDIWPASGAILSMPMRTNRRVAPIVANKNTRRNTRNELHELVWPPFQAGTQQRRLYGSVLCRGPTVAQDVSILSVSE